jgi:hypothetical protein
VQVQRQGNPYGPKIRTSAPYGRLQRSESGEACREANLILRHPMRQRRSLAEPRAYRLDLGTYAGLASKETVESSRRETIVIIELAAQPLASTD